MKMCGSAHSSASEDLSLLLLNTNTLMGLVFFMDETMTEKMNTHENVQHGVG